MTNKEIDRIAAAIRKVAETNGYDLPTLRAIAQEIEFAIGDTAGAAKAAGFRTAATGVIDLSGIDWLAKMEAR